jgi:hypothetical protein
MISFLLTYVCVLLTHKLISKNTTSIDMICLFVSTYLVEFIIRLF